MQTSRKLKIATVHLSSTVNLLLPNGRRAFSTTPKTSKVCIYSGQGTSHRCKILLESSLKRCLCPRLHRVSYISSKEIRQGRLQQDNVKMLAIGGGSDRGLVKSLGLVGMQMVKNFVLAGGSYLGICAGAYFACDRVHFDQYGKEEVCDARDLKLFPGMGIGPVIPVSHTHVIPNSSTITISLPHTTISSTPALLTTSDHTLVTYINRGGNFSLYPQSTIIKRFPHVKDLQTIATYPSLPNSPVAVVKVEVAGGGMVVLSFPHLEFCAFELRKADFEQQTDLRELQEADQRREALLKAVLEWTGLRVSPTAQWIPYSGALAPYYYFTGVSDCEWV